MLLKSDLEKIFIKISLEFRKLDVIWVIKFNAFFSLRVFILIKSFSDVKDFPSINVDVSFPPINTGAITNESSSINPFLINTEFKVPLDCIVTLSHQFVFELIFHPFFWINLKKIPFSSSMKSFMLDQLPLSKYSTIKENI